MDGFLEVVQHAWTCDEIIVDPFHRLDVLLRNTARALTSWSQRKVGNIKLQLGVAKLVILRLDGAQDVRLLTPGERWLRGAVKQMVLGLASLDRTIARQRSRIHWLSEGDANTKLFHLVANGRKTKNFIPALVIDGRVITDQRGKEEAFLQTFRAMLGQRKGRDHTLDWEPLNIRQVDLSELDRPFTEEEVWAVIKELPKDRAPGPDGFIGVFFHMAWDIIKVDVMAVLHKLFLNNGHGFGRLNQALISLIPKNDEACHVNDFRPISLVHCLPKLASKLMASRVCPRMVDLMIINQSAYNRRKTIQNTVLIVSQK